MFVDDALPGERVVAEVTSHRSRFLRARTVEVLLPSPARVVPPCPYVPECGGCQLQHAGYEAQLALKLRVLGEALRRAGVKAPPSAVIPAEQPLRYRIRGEFHVVPPAGGGHGLGFNRRRSYDLVAIDDCLIHHSHITDALSGIRRALDATGGGALRSLRLTTTPARRELLWAARGGREADGLQDALVAELPDWLVHQDSLTIAFDGARIDGRPDQLIFRVDSDTFIQVNHSQAHRLYGTALDYIGDRPGRLVEGYAGFGAISVLAATRPDESARPERATLIEAARSAAILGRLHLRLHGIAAMSDYRHGRVEDQLPRFDPGEVDTLVVDPPRAGLGANVIKEATRLRPSRVVYISCDPATMGRDLALFVEAGYQVQRQTMVDMFPNTYHLETVTLLAR
jgi:tRNA/tmRNA/rRNA uracil-C5-methylase (TrmA/RlmC/RlmD family)